MEAGDREAGAAGLRAGGGAQERDAGGQVATEKAVEERLRLEGDDAGAGGQQGAGAVAGVGADVEGEIPGRDDAARRSGRDGRCATGGRGR